MLWQLLPVPSQSCHWYAYEVGDPFQLPFDAVSVCPSVVVPEIVGGAVLVGAPGCTTAVCCEVAWAEPAAFVSVTTTRTVVPTSPGPSAYVWAVAPWMFWQLLPAGSHDCPWWRYLPGVPYQVPFAAVSVWPSVVVPEIDGGAVLAGGAAATVGVCAEVACADPAAFVSVT